MRSEEEAFEWLLGKFLVGFSKFCFEQGLGNFKVAFGFSRICSPLIFPREETPYDAYATLGTSQVTYLSVT